MASSDRIKSSDGEDSVCSFCNGTGVREIQSSGDHHTGYDREWDDCECSESSDQEDSVQRPTDPCTCRQTCGDTPEADGGTCKGLRRVRAESSDQEDAEAVSDGE